MPISKDCVNTQSQDGRNLTPVDLVRFAQYVLVSIELDTASDFIANKTIGAERILTFEDDGLSQDWEAKTLFLNPPGQTVTGGTLEERKYWRKQLLLPKKRRGKKPKNVRSANASEWGRKLGEAYLAGKVKSAIYLAYRGGSMGSLGTDFISSSLCCLTASGAASTAVNGSGRLAFDTVEGGERTPQTENTQCSGIFLLSRNIGARKRFVQGGSEFGVVLEVAR